MTLPVNLYPEIAPTQIQVTATYPGASANVVISQIANRNNCPVSFMSFTKQGLPFMLASLVIAHIYIYVRYFM